MKLGTSKNWITAIVIGACGAMAQMPAALAQNGSSQSAGQAAGTKATKATTITIGTKGDNLAFDKTSMSAKAGQEVRVTFQNKASATSNLQHNWVLVKPGTADTVAAAGITAGPDKSYLPDSPDVIAHTKLLNPGQKETVTFTAPTTPGDYQFICSFPGHATTMRGTFTVK